MLCSAFPGGRQTLLDAVTLTGFSVAEVLEAVEAEVLRPPSTGLPALETSRSLAPAMGDARRQHAAAILTSEEKSADLQIQHA